MPRTELLTRMILFNPYLVEAIHLTFWGHCSVKIANVRWSFPGIMTCDGWKALYMINNFLPAIQWNLAMIPGGSSSVCYRHTGHCLALLCLVYPLPRYSVDISKSDFTHCDRCIVNIYVIISSAGLLLVKILGSPPFYWNSCGLFLYVGSLCIPTAWCPEVFKNFFYVGTTHQIITPLWAIARWPNLACCNVLSCIRWRVLLA